MPARKYIPGQTAYLTEASDKQLTERLQQIEQELTASQSVHKTADLTKERAYVLWELEQRQAESNALVSELNQQFQKTPV